MSRPKHSSRQRSRSGSSLKGLPLVTVFMLALLALLAGRGVEAAGHAARGGPGGNEALAQALGRRSVAAGGEDGSARGLIASGEVAARSGLRAGLEATGPGERRDELTAGLDHPGAAAGQGAPVDGLSEPPSQATDLDGRRGEGSYHRGGRQGEWRFFDQQGILREVGSFSAGNRVGLWRQFASNGQLVQVAEFDDGRREGVWRRFNEAGALLEEGQYSASAPEGRWVRRYSDGSVKERGLYVSGLRDGLWEFFDDLGRPTLRTGTYRAGGRID